MKLQLLGALWMTWLVIPSASAVVFINEVFINPPGSADDFREFIEFQGTPGMKLDGYAIALVNGVQAKYWTLGTPLPANQEVDEFFSLDGLRLGPNGLLVIGVSDSSWYPSELADTNHANWNTLWNGFMDTTGKLQNDGANTIFLIRNRPGAQSGGGPGAPPADLRWGKDMDHDAEFFHSVADPQVPPPPYFDQWGNGNLDRGEARGQCSGGVNDGDRCVSTADCLGGACLNPGVTLDLKGVSTPSVTDDLEVVDEVSYEHDRGWEYDLDDRHVDLDSPIGGLPARHVHALDDPQGINPDCLSRVDYRTSGPGWPPAPGATGEMANGNNWPDTATEQWVRGESKTATGGGTSPPYYYDNGANTNPDAIQPYLTQVPRWLADGSAPDYDFAGTNTYEIMAGRVNPLAVPFIPGDADRDGDCDANDITKVAAVFGNDNWIFSNSYNEAPEGDDGDPAAQTRPWDADATGTNGIDPSDLQWTLDFQGDTTGHVVGVRYDSPTPAASGVYLNSGAAVACTVTVAAATACGRALGHLYPGDTVELTVRGAVTAGANLAAGQENGIMQFAHDLTLSAGGVVRVAGVQPLGAFATTRANLQTPEGTTGDLGITLVNGYTTTFTTGLSGAADLYRVTLLALPPGTVTATIGPATDAKFAASTPRGLKIGHTAAAGNPSSAAYAAAALSLTVGERGDVSGDGLVNLADQAPFVACLLGPGVSAGPGCTAADLDCDNDVDLADWMTFQLAIGAP